MSNTLENARKLASNIKNVFGTHAAQITRNAVDGRKLSTAGLRRKAAHLRAAGNTDEALKYSRAAHLRTAGNVAKAAGLVGAGAVGGAAITARSNRNKDKVARIANEAR